MCHFHIVIIVTSLHHSQTTLLSSPFQCDVETLTSQINITKYTISVQSMTDFVTVWIDHLSSMELQATVIELLTLKCFKILSTVPNKFTLASI